MSMTAETGVACEQRRAERKQVSPRSTHFLVWSLDDTRTIRLLAGLTGLFAAYLFVYLRFMAKQHYMPHDFFALWSYGRVAMSSSGSLLYDQGLLHQAQIRLGMPAGWQMPFPYPPFVLAMFVPMSVLPSHAALAAWLALTVAAYLVACCLGERRFICWVLVLVAPTTTVAVACGQTGFLSAALMIGGLRLLEKRPILAGLLFACLAFKAQLGFLLPAILVSARQWRALASGVATGLVILVLTTAVFGVGIWSAFAAAVPEYQRWFDSTTVAMQGLPTVLSCLQQLGVRGYAAHIGQWATTGAVFLLVCWLFRNGLRPRLLPAVPILTILGTPHAAVYDLPMLAGAIMMTVSIRCRNSEPLHLFEILAFVALVSFPATVVIRNFYCPMGPPILAFAAIVMLTVGDHRQPTPGCASTRRHGRAKRTAWSLS